VDTLRLLQESQERPENYISVVIDPNKEEIKDAILKDAEVIKCLTIAYL